MNELKKALEEHVKDEILASQFLSIWPVVEGILEAFSRATGLPIFAYLNGRRVFQSSITTMPPFCAVMLGNSWTAARCQHDGQVRALTQKYDVDGRFQYCHAGMLNGRLELDTKHIGSLVILYGSKKHSSCEARERNRKALKSIRSFSSHMAKSLELAYESDTNTVLISESNHKLMQEIANILCLLIEATVAFRSLAMNMAHELTLTMLSLGLLAREFTLEDSPKNSSSPNPAGSPPTDPALGLILTQARLGLYIVRNFLSYTSDSRHQQTLQDKATLVDLTEVLTEMVELYSIQAMEKGISFQIDDFKGLPKIRAVREELARLFNNVLSNAIKYSYHSTLESERVIKIRTKNPYDPGFSRRRFSIVVENYGLGVSKEESANVTTPGYRGRQAVAEVPIGAGIGLSESVKILRTLRGEFKFRSRKIHENLQGEPTYLTSVELIFPH